MQVFVMLCARLRFALLLVLILSTGLATAQNTPPAPQPPPSESVNPTEMQETFDSPREAMTVFLENMVAERSGYSGSWRQAALTLDLDHVGMGYDTLARQATNDLYEVINHIELVNVESLPGSDFGSDVYIWKRLNSGQIRFEKSETGNWRFSRATIDVLPAMLVEFSGEESVAGVGMRNMDIISSPSTWMRLNLPKWVFDRTFILENFQWIAMLIIIIAGLFIDRLVRSLVRSVLTGHLVHRKVDYDAEYLETMAKWIGICLGAVFWLYGVRSLGLPENFYVVLRIAVLLVAVTSGVLGALRGVDLFCGVLARRAESTANKFDDILVPLLRKGLKIFIASFGLVFIADNLEVNIASLLAGLGLGGLAFALAAKDTVENLFGSITVLLDRPFHIGDWVNVNGVDGTVESIGLRSTRLRTFYNSVITIPNSNLIKANVDNYGMRRYRRIKTTLSVTYNTPPDKLDAFCEGIRELIRRHPYTRKDYFHVWMNDFGAHSLDILLYCFVETPDWATELRERHRLMLHILRLAHRLGVEFAFPTQTLYLERGAGPARPDQAPFRTLEDQMDFRADARRQVDEMMKSLLVRPGVPFPPPPVDFGMPIDPEEASIPLRNRGGDESGEGAGR